MILPATPHALRYVARSMCRIDAAEVFATRHDTDPDAIAAEIHHIGGGYICLRDMVPLSAFGAMHIWPGVWSVWMFSTDKLDMHAGAQILRHFRRVVLPDVLAAGVHRVQCDSLKKHHTAHEFIERFGGRHESIMRNYGRGGEDFVRFVWDREALEAQMPKVHPGPNCVMNQSSLEDVHARPVIGL